MADITIKPPSRDKPGFWRRQKRVTAIQHRMRHDPSPDAIDEMIRFIADECEIEAPAGTDIEEAIWNLSEAEYDAIMEAMRAERNGVPPQNGA